MSPVGKSVRVEHHFGHPDRQPVQGRRPHHRAHAAPVEDRRERLRERLRLGHRRLAPIIEANGGLSGSYSASMAAVWSLTNSLRLDLAPKGIIVTGLHVGYVDTDMTAGIVSPKSRPEDVVRQALDGVERDAYEVLADDVSRSVKSQLAGSIVDMYPQLESAR